MAEPVICVIPGDGIGQEVTPAAVAVLRATGLPLRFVDAEAGWETFQRTGAALPEATLAAAQAADAVLFGAVASPSFPVPGYRSPIIALRKALGLYANIRPTIGRQNENPGRRDAARCVPTTNAARTDAARTDAARTDATRCVPVTAPIDLVVVRENTEGLYAGRERVEDGGDTAIAERVITRGASERIVRAAFELARARAAQRAGDLTTERTEATEENPETILRSSAAGGRWSVVGGRSSPTVTIVHKANVLRETCGLFRRVALEVAAQYPDVAHDELLVDNCALQLVLHPERFDVIVTTNLFGDILSDVACAWGGGLGLAVSANYGERGALFEPVHGAAPDIAGRGIANPLAAIGCAALLLEYIGSGRGDAAFGLWAQRITSAVQHVVKGGPHTPDLAGSGTTSEVTQAIIDTICRL